MKNGLKPYPPALLSGASLVLLMSVLPAAAAPARQGPVRLDGAVQTIQSAFRRGEASRLRSLLPREGRIYLSVPSLTSGRGYFSAGQCESILAEAFRRHPPQDFRTDPPQQEEDGRATLQGHMKVTGRRGKTVSLILHFLLSQEDEVWYLREIREHQPA
ncbi:MAG: hypothetical protein ACE5ID_07660 [Acidobacteriota bacterium]